MLFLARWAAAGEPAWIDDDPGRALEAGKSGGRPVLIFWRDAGGTVSALAAEDLSGSAALLDWIPDHFVPARLERGKFGELAKRFGIEESPAVTVLDADGVWLVSWRGFRPAGDLLVALKNLPGVLKRKTVAEAALAGNTGDSAARVALGDALLDLERPDAAREQFEKALGDSAVAAAAWWGLARVRLAAGQPSSALEAAAKVEELDPQNHLGRTDNAAALRARMEEGPDASLARAALAKVCESFPGTDGATEALYLEAAILANVDGDFAGARERLRRVRSDGAGTEWEWRAAFALARLEGRGAGGGR